MDKVSWLLQVFLRTTRDWAVVGKRPVAKEIRHFLDAVYVAGRVANNEGLCYHVEDVDLVSRYEQEGYETNEENKDDHIKEQVLVSDMYDFKQSTNKEVVYLWTWTKQLRTKVLDL